MTPSSASSVFEEVELRLRTTITPHSITGYEVNCSVSTNSSNNYLQIVRWNGALGSLRMSAWAMGALIVLTVTS